MPDTMQPITLAVAVAIGILLGVIYFGGLWWTVRRMPQAQRPWRLYIESLVLRLAVVLVALYAVLNNYDWPQLVASMVGFLGVRVVLVRKLGKLSSADAPAQKVS